MKPFRDIFRGATACKTLSHDIDREGRGVVVLVQARPTRALQLEVGI